MTNLQWFFINQRFLCKLFAAYFACCTDVKGNAHKPSAPNSQLTALKNRRMWKMSQTLAIQTKTDNNHSTKKRHSLKTTTNTMPITRTRTSNHAKPYNLTIKSDIGPHLQFIQHSAQVQNVNIIFPVLRETQRIPVLNSTLSLFSSREKSNSCCVVK